MIAPGAFKAWLATAPAGDVIIWHTGFLARERKAWVEFRGNRRFPHEAMPGLDVVARVIAKAADRGLVTLVQKRVDKGQFQYVAVRSSPPAARAIRGYSIGRRIVPVAA
jgi:hypothetical protein